MPGHSEEIEVVRRLYACASAPATDAAPAWQPVLDALAGLTRANAATLIIEPATGRRHIWQQRPGPLPAPEPLHRMRPDRVYAQGELDDSADPALRALRVSLTGDGAAWLVLTRETGDFRSAEGAQLGRLGPHLGPAAEIWLRLRNERARAATGALIGERLATGWLALDATLRVLDADATARRLIDGAAGLRLTPAARLEIVDPQVARATRAAIDSALAGGDPAPVALDASLALSLDRWPADDGPEGCARGLIRAAPRAAGFDTRRLAAALGLSRSEARLAARLCDGETLTEAAEALDWTLETARSCSKQVFARSGARGQTDLVRRVLGGALWLMPGGFDHPPSAR